MITNDTAATTTEDQACEEVLRICNDNAWSTTTYRATGRYRTALGYAFRVEVRKHRPCTSLSALLRWLKPQSELVAAGDSWTEVLGKLRTDGEL